MSNNDEGTVNPFVALRALKEEQQVGETPKPAAPNPFLQRDPNPFKRIRRGAPYSMREEHPIAWGLGHMISRQASQLGSALWFAATHPQPKEGHGDSFEASQAAAQRTLSDFQALPPEQATDIQEGTAFLMSFGTGGAVEAIPKLGPALGKWGSYALNEFLGGGIYGSLRPLDEGESRIEATLGDATKFMTAGLAFKGIETGIGALIKGRLGRLPVAQRDAAAMMVKEYLDRVDTELATSGVNVAQLPPDAREKLEEPILRQVLQELEPNAVDLTQTLREEADRQMEAAGREANRPTIDAPFGKPRPLTPTEEFDAAVAKALPPHPLEETPALEASAAAPEPPPKEKIVSIAVMGKDGRVYKPKRGEILHPELIGNLVEFDGVSPNEFLDPVTNKYAEGASTGYATTAGAYITKDEATAARLEGQTPAERFRADERVVAPAVRGESGKIYVGEATHSETIDAAIRAGAPKAEFRGSAENFEHPNRGFRTSKREFVSREEASKIMKRPVPLHSSEMHNEKMLPTESVEAADNSARTAGESLASTVGDATGKDVTGDAQTMLLDGASDQAAARLTPLQTSTPEVVLAAKEIQKLIEIHGLPVRRASAHLRELLSAALDREGPAADRDVLLGLTTPGPIELQMGRKIGSSETKKIREQLARTLRREKPLIEVSPHERIAAPWEETDPELTIPKKMDGVEIAGHVRDDKLDEFNKTLLDIARDKRGFIAADVMVRLATAGLGGLIEAVAYQDDNLSDGAKTALKAFGGMLLLTAAFPAFKNLAERSQLVKDVIKMYSPSRAMSAGGEVWRNYMEAFTRSGLKQHDIALAVAEHFPDEASQRAAMYVLDEGMTAPEFYSLTAKQQQMAVVMHQFNLRMAALISAKKGLREYQESYMRHLLQPAAYQKWIQMGGARAMPKSSVRQLETWALKEGVPGPIMNPAIVHSFHIAQADRALAVANLGVSLKQAGRIVDLPKAGQPMPVGWQELKGVPGMRGKMSPIEDAHDLEIISRMDAPKSALMAALDRTKSRWVRSIMFWWWEHGLNAMRSYLALSFNPTKYFDGVKWLENPAIREEMANVGVNVYGQSSDYLLRVQENWKNLLTPVKLGNFGAKIDKLQDWNDRKLWEKIIPALQTFAYVTRMRDWVERNAGKFGGPEYLAEARRVADFANTIAGKVPQHLADPRLARGMRLMMFSPQWTGSRIAMWAHAAGEVSDMMSGKLNPRDALYMPLKMRQLAWGVALTYVGSMLLSGKAPEFNPNNSRFYMNTGSRDSRGREVGVDLTGWWQDEFRFFSRPFDFLMNRLNPILKVGAETLQGRDYLGRPMTTGQSIGNIINSFGPPTQIASDVLRVGRAAAGGQRIAGGDVWQMASRTLATGNVAVLPPAMNATLAKYARKILITQGIPASSDHIYELAQRMRANLLAGRDLIDESTVTLLAARKRSSMWEFPVPGSAAFNGIWQEARGVLADFQQ